MNWIKARLARRDASPEDVNLALQKKLQKREALCARITDKSLLASYVLLLAGFIYIFAIPLPQLGKGTYVSENALQPAQVNVYWSWPEVQKSDHFARQVESWSTLSSIERCAHLQAAFQDLGLPASTQTYQFSNSSEGCNAYATIRAPKTDGSESIVLAASWKSRDGGRVNTRGVALVFGLAHHLSKFSLWSKDIILLIADDYIEGTHAFVSAVHEVQQPNLLYEPLNLDSGPIWAALHLDYPHHSFDRIGLYFEGVNGILPNLDLLTSIVHIIKWVGSVPSVLHAAPNVDANKLGLLDKYKQSFGNVFEQMGYGALGRPSGPEGVYARYRIDALALYAIPAEGPFGFYHMGRTIESSLRSINNLLERFHATAFLYIMTSPRTFVPLANYIGAPVLVGVALTLKGLNLWYQATKKGSTTSTSSIVSALVAMTSAHLFGLWLLRLLQNGSTSLPLALFSSLAATAGLSETLSSATRIWLESFNLLLAGMSISVLATINVSCAILLAFIVGLPLMLRPSSRPLQLLHLVLVTVLNPLLLLQFMESSKSLEDWQKFDVALVPLALLCVLPLQMQSASLSLSSALARRRKAKVL